VAPVVCLESAVSDYLESRIGGDPSQQEADRLGKRILPDVVLIGCGAKRFSEKRIR